MGAESAARKARVLNYPDLAHRLCEPPLGYKRPQDWTGWIPPAVLEEEACEKCRTDPGRGGCKRKHLQSANVSKRRAALVAIDLEAQRRDDAARDRAGGSDGV